jgi:hypothetical protein
MAKKNVLSGAPSCPRKRISLPSRIFIGLVLGALLGGLASA